MTNKESIEALAEEVLRSIPTDMKRPCEGYHNSDIWTLHVPQFTKYYMNLNREDGTLSIDGKIIGASTFEYCWITFYDRQGNPKNQEVRPNTVIVDSDLLKVRFDGEHPGRYRFTEMHECCHHLMVRTGFAHKEPVKFRYVGNVDSREERETDYLAALLLMPESVLTAMMLKERGWEPFISYEGEIPLAQQKSILRMAHELKVSPTALNKRLDDEEWFEYRPIYEFRDPDRPGYNPLEGLYDDTD